MSAAKSITPDQIKVFADHMCLVDCSENVQGMFGVKLIRALESLVDEEAFEDWVALVITFAEGIDINEDYFENFVEIGKSVKELGKKLFLVNPPSSFDIYLKAKGLKGLAPSAPDLVDVKKTMNLAPTPSEKPDSSKSKIDVNFVNPIIQAVIETLGTQCQMKVAPEKAFLKNSKTRLSFDVAAFIQLKSSAFNGSICLCLTKNVFLKIMQGLLMEEFEEVSQDLIDGIAEVLNITFGVAKRELNRSNYQIEKAIPNVVHGEAVTGILNDNRVGIILPFKGIDFDSSEFNLLISLDPKG